MKTPLSFTLPPHKWIPAQWRQGTTIKYCSVFKCIMVVLKILTQITWTTTLMEHSTNIFWEVRRDCLSKKMPGILYAFKRFWNALQEFPTTWIAALKMSSLLWDVDLFTRRAFLLMLWLLFWWIVLHSLVPQLVVIINSLSERLCIAIQEDRPISQTVPFI